MSTRICRTPITATRIDAFELFLICACYIIFYTIIAPLPA